MIDSRIVKDMAEAIRKPTASTEPFDTEAEVRRIEGSIAWVHIPGGVDETPVEKTINAKEGDKVRVRVSGGQAWMTGNQTAPPTDDTEAKAAGKKAAEAYDKSNKATESAEEAAKAAEEANKAAGTAKSAADHAENSAKTANTAANNALTQFSVVEDVAGVLSWISDHGSYDLSTDTEVVPGKFYFTRTGSGTSADPYVYNIVVNPTGSPIENGYYILDSIDEAVSNYISSHLALTDAGLWVVKDNNGYKILLANDGMKVYDSSGNLVATFGESIIFSSSHPQYIGGEDAYIIFFDSDDDSVPDAIRIGGSKVLIGSNKKLSDVLTSLDISARQTQSGAEIDIAGQTVSLSNGEDATVVRIDSSHGVLFKNNYFSTVLTVTVQKGSKSITNITELHAVYGAGSYLQWYWRKFDDDTWRVISSADRHLSNDGFSFAVTPDDVDEKIVFKCDLEV